MAYIKISSVLLAYEVPLIVLGLDGQERPYVGVNYADGSESHLFYFARVIQEDIEKLTDAKVDVRYLITHRAKGKFEFGELWGDVGNVARTKPRDSVHEEMLPRPGMFIPVSKQLVDENKLKAIHIDGRWGIDDLRKFSDLVQDSYAMVYALSGKGTASVKQRIGSLFQRYPWRGGFSSVNFFDDLYSKIPRADRADIRSIQYASPGKIEFRMNKSVAESIRKIVADINHKDSKAKTAYDDVQKWLRDKKWLGKAQSDLRLTPIDKKDLTERLGMLCSALGLNSRTDDILELAQADPLGAVKIILAYYRRLKGLADYVATGKVQDLFGESSAEIPPYEEADPN